jgi:hypothetical protein
MLHTLRLSTGRDGRASSRLSLESLEDRVVPSTIDLTTAGASQSNGGVFFNQSVTQPAGSGVFDAFVRIHGLGGAGQEQGYNTDARPLQFDENNSPTFTRSLQLGEVPVVTVGTTNYRVFLLDINQKASGTGSLLSLDQLQLFVGGSGNLTGYDPASHTLASGSLIAFYDLNPDLGNSNWVELNGRLTQGLGKSDMALLVPDAVVISAAVNMAAANPGASPFLYVFSRFGDHYATNGGFEQWGVQEQTPTSSVSGYVYHDIAGSGMFQSGEGIGGVMMTLTGTDVNNQSVTLNAVTDGNGLYYFDGLKAGTYTVTETEPTGYTPGAGAVNVGTVNGLLDGVNPNGTSVNQPLRYISTIGLNAGDNGFNYDFGELVRGS